MFPKKRSDLAEKKEVIVRVMNGEDSKSIHSPLTSVCHNLLVFIGNGSGVSPSNRFMNKSIRDRCR